ncbi:MAG: penicillin acylase family protein [Chloroflexia bacterium]
MDAIRSALETGMGAIVRAGVTSLSRRSLPVTDGKLRMPGLHGPVEVIRDRWGVPHIYALDVHDLMFAQGFVHAQDRLFQMDFQRRLVAGRLSEVLGRATVNVDRWIRILSMRWAAEREAEGLDSEVRTELEAYAAGVNAHIDACISGRKLPVEFTLLRYRPEPWTPADTLSWGKLLSWILSMNWETELLRARLVARLGPERAAELEPDYFEHWPVIVRRGSRVRGQGLPTATMPRPLTPGESAVERLAEEARKFTGPGPLEGVGSNAWALAGWRTEGRAPLLANDMHLAMGLPCVWYENHLAGGGLDVTGVSLPGIPYVIVGHNGRVAWGMTYGFADVQDLYIERLRKGAGEQVQYEYKGEWLEADVRRERIKVRGGKARAHRVISTRHGPIINALAPRLSGEEPLALRWASLDRGNAFRAIRAMNRAHNCGEFREALRDWTDPVLNAVYADTEGNIQYSYTGNVPVRARGTGEVPVPGWTGEYEWTGYIPFYELPHLDNPPEGYVVTANNRVVGDDYPHFLSREFAGGDRAQRIVEMIEAREESGRKADMAYTRQMQFDQLSVAARVVVGYLRELRAEDAELGDVLKLIEEWDCRLSPESAAAAVYEVFLQKMLRHLTEVKLGDLAGGYGGEGPVPGLQPWSMFGLRAWEWLLKTLAEPESNWFEVGDRGHERKRGAVGGQGFHAAPDGRAHPQPPTNDARSGGGRDEVMRVSLREAVDYLKERCGPRTSDWAWGKLHRLTYAHPLGSARVLAGTFNRGPYPVGGDHTTVWAAVSRLEGEDVIGPPFRFIADLGDLRRSRGLLSPGQSGQPGSRHYDDGVEAWPAGDYHPMLFAREDVEREAEGRLRLLP